MQDFMDLTVSKILKNILLISLSNFFSPMEVFAKSWSTEVIYFLLLLMYFFLTLDLGEINDLYVVNDFFKYILLLCR